MRALARVLVAICCLLAIWSGTNSLCAEELHVSPIGNDQNSGSVQQPLATLHAARDRIREKHQNPDAERKPVTIWIHGGVYKLSQSLELTEQDSGTAEAPIVWAAMPGETVRLVGGKVIEEMKPLGDSPVRSRLPESARDKVHVIDLKDQGIEDSGKLVARGRDHDSVPAPLELFHAKESLQLARWPNQGWLKTGKILETAQAFTFLRTPNQKWQSAKDVWVHGFFENDWADRYESVAEWNLHEKSVKVNGDMPHQPGHRFRFINVLEELDAPGEWYFDRETHQLYVWAPPGTVPQDFMVSVLDTPISFYDVSYVTLRGVTIEAARVCAVEIVGGNFNHIDQCTLRHIGNLGAHVHYGTNHRISHCHIHETGDGAIRLEGGDDVTLDPCQHVVEHNHIHHFNRWVFSHRPAIHVYGVGHQVANNLIHDGPDSAIIVSGNDNIIEGNEIHSVCLETNDVGAFYMSHDWTERGNVVRNNYFHDLGSGEFDGIVAVYLDDFASGTLVEGNVFERAGRGVLIGGGRDNQIVNNLFVDMHAGVQVDARGGTWARHWIDDTASHLWNRLRDVTSDEDSPYVSKYPELAHLESDDPAVPKGNRIERNVFQCEITIDLHDGLDVNTVTLQGNWLQGNPKLELVVTGQSQSGQWQLSPDSPARQLGIIPIAWDRIGIKREPRTGAYFTGMSR